MAEDLILRPNQDISKGIEYPSGTHYTQIDEEVADDDTTYLQQYVPEGGDEDGIDYIGIQNPSVAGAINSVKLVMRGMGNHWSHCYGRIYTYSTLYGNIDCSGSAYETKDQTWTTNPKTGSAWTWQEIIDLQIYIRLHANGGDPIVDKYEAWARCTQAYIVVNYNPLYAPTVTTQAATNITYNSATGNGNITDTGGENATERGFEYKEGAEGEVSKVYDTGDFGTGAFSKEITDLKPGTLYYVRAYAKNSAGTGYGDWVTFTTEKTVPTVTTQEATDIDKDSFTANGNITATGGENCTVRGFKYGYTPTDTWDVHDNGDFGTGAFTKAITGLLPNTIYWIRAYATNSEGTSYGDWVKVATASAGTTPSGTKIQLAGDYSGYVDQMHASEQDLGVNYKGYFVLSTDLADKQGLAFYKRLLYLTNYFKKETSGTVKIYVKCDSEADWREIGEVDLTGSEDILMEDLGIDELGKHFLIKFEGENIFRYIGTIFWYLVQGVR